MKLIIEYLLYLLDLDILDLSIILLHYLWILIQTTFVKSFMPILQSFFENLGAFIVKVVLGPTSFLLSFLFYVLVLTIEPIQFLLLFSFPGFTSEVLVVGGFLSILIILNQFHFFRNPPLGF